LEETLIPDVEISIAKLTVKNNTYDFYCKRKIKSEAELIKDDLIANGFDALVRKGVSDYHMFFEVWWRKN
jgi:hypothetical protein